MKGKAVFQVLAKGLKDYRKGFIPELNRFQLAKIKEMIDIFNLLSYEATSVEEVENRILNLATEISLDLTVTRCAIARLWLSCYKGYNANSLSHLQKRDWESFLYENGALCPKLPKTDICNELIRRPVLKCEIIPHIPFNKWIFFEIQNEFLEN